MKARTREYWRYKTRPGQYAWSRRPGYGERFVHESVVDELLLEKKALKNRLRGSEVSTRNYEDYYDKYWEVYDKLAKYEEPDRTFSVFITLLILSGWIAFFVTFFATFFV